jgi:SAM-dependent methyltransferase
VDFLAALAGDGPALELAVGTGRVALPLAGRGVPVSGIELSAPMAEQLRRKSGGEQIPVVVGDMATSTVAGQFSLVFLVWKSLSNLLTQDEQVECFANAARHLSSGGRFIVELWVPELRRLPEGQRVAPAFFSPEHLVLDEFDVAAQRCISPLSSRPGRNRPVLLRSLPLRVARRAGPDGPTGGDAAGKSTCRLVAHPVSLGKRRPRLRVAQGVDRGGAEQGPPALNRHGKRAGPRGKDRPQSAKSGWVTGRR